MTLVAWIFLRCFRYFSYEDKRSAVACWKFVVKDLFDLSSQYLNSIFSLFQSFPPEPFNATKYPPTFTKGRQYSHRSLRFATALAVAMSNCSRHSILLPSSSALPCMQVAPRSRLSESCARKFILLLRLSKSVSFISSRTIFSGQDGNPAPVPTSITVAFSFTSKSVKG